MKSYDYTLDESVDARPRLGLIVLQQDETIEGDFRDDFQHFPCDLHFSRVKSGLDVSVDTLGQMETDLPLAASLLPGGRDYDVIGYGCTSGTSVIGADKTAEIIRTGAKARHVTNPLTATIAWCKHHNVQRLALLSPYVEPVNDAMRAAFLAAGIQTDPFGSFNVAQEARVVRISAPSIVKAAIDLCQDTKPDGVFLSCTNLRTAQALPMLQTALDLPIVSSNAALCWHMKQLLDFGGEN